ncbi:hypothetical protein KEM52_005325, partial [Ascosphaera acerosa]
TFEILIDGESAKTGSLLDDFVPAVNPPKEIDDPADSKPADWVDEARIPDPEARKPADWDEDAPFEIPDDEAAKPDDWLDDEPRMVPDPEAEKPEDWDDEEDGDWEAPLVPNPKCEEVSGCGEWERPMVRNPAYKGKWSAPMIENPAYKGPWAPRKIANPDYFEDLTPSNFEPMGGIGFEIWTMQNDILFDNIYIGHSVDDAKALQAETFDVKRPIEDAADIASRPKADDADAASRGATFVDSFAKAPVQYVRQQAELFLRIAQVDFVEACKMVPEIAGGAVALLVTLLAIVVGTFSAGGKAKAAPAPAPAPAGGKKGGAKKEEAKKEKEEAGSVKGDKKEKEKKEKGAEN